MKIDNEFTVSVPVERAWEVLTDLQEVALCLPGARLTGIEGDVYSGEIRVKVGPVISQYAGTAQFLEKDDALHRAVIDAKGRDSRGAGNASAVITLQLHGEGDRTAVTVDTDMKISGKIAQLGGGMIKEVSEKLMGQFVECLEAKLVVSPPSESPAGAAPSETPSVTAPSETPSVTAPSETPSVTAPTATQGATPTATQGATPPQTPATTASSQTFDPEPADLMSLAGGAVAKRLIPALLILVLVVVVVYLVAR
jgi:carbon monoxide dehydrogenase subunit G